MDFKTVSSSTTPYPVRSSATATATRATSSSTPRTPFATLYAAIERIAQTFRGGDPSQNRAVDDLNDALQSLSDQAVNQESQAKLILRRLAALPPSLYPAISLKQLPRLMPVAQAIKQLVADWFASPAKFPPAVMMRDFDRMQALLTSAQFSHLDAVVESSAQYLTSTPAPDYKAVALFTPLPPNRLSFCYHVATVYSQHADQELQSKCRTILEDQRFRRGDFQEAWKRRKQYQRIFQWKPAYLHQQMPSLGHWSHELSRLVWEYAQDPEESYAVSWKVDPHVASLRLVCEALLAEVEACTAAHIHRLVKIYMSCPYFQGVKLSSYASQIIWLFIHTLKREEEVKEAVFQLFWAVFVRENYNPQETNLIFRLLVGLKQVIEFIRAEQIPNADDYLKEIGRALRDLLEESQLQRALKFPPNSIKGAKEYAASFKDLFTSFIPFPLAELRAPQTVLTSQHVQAYREHEFFYQIDRSEIAQTISCLQKRVIQDKSPFAAELLAEMLGLLNFEDQSKMIKEIGDEFDISIENFGSDHLSDRPRLFNFLRRWESLDAQQKQKWDLLLILYIAHSAEDSSLQLVHLSITDWMVRHPEYATYRFFAFLQSRLEAIWNEPAFTDLRARLKSQFFKSLNRQLSAESQGDTKALLEPGSARPILSRVIDSLGAFGYKKFLSSVSLVSFDSKWRNFLDHRALLQLMRRLIAIQKQRLAPFYLQSQLHDLGELIQKCRVHKAQRAQWVEEMHRELQTLRAVLHAPRYKLAEMQKVAEILQEIEQDLSDVVEGFASS